MKCSFTTMATPGMALEDCLTLAQQHGLDGVDIRCHQKLGEVQLDEKAHRLAEITALFHSRHLNLPCILCYNTWPAHANEDWETAAAEFHKMTALAAQLQAPAIRLFPRIPKEVVEHDAYIMETAAFFRRVLSESTNNIAIYLQNHRHSLNARQTATFCRTVNSDRLGMVYSPDHVFLMGESRDHLLEDIAFCVKEIYIADMDAESKAAFPGEGIIPLKETIRFFQKQGFEGYYSFKWEKIWNPALADATEVLPRFVNFMKPFRN